LPDPETTVKPFNILGTTRRGFLSGCAACAAGAFCPATAAPVSPKEQAGEKVKIRLVFSHSTQDRRGWPYVDFDYAAMKTELSAKLRQACPYAEFDPVTVMTDADVSKVLESGGAVDGHLVYMLGGGGPGGKMASSGRPVVLVDHLYGGTNAFLHTYGAARKKGFPVAGIASSRFQDVVQSVKALYALKKMRTSVILDVTDGNTGGGAKELKSAFGAELRQVSSEELNAAYEKAALADARKCAATWIQNAQKVVEPSREEITKSARVYLAMKDVMDRNKSLAITVDCLQLVYGGKMPAYPCLGFFQLNSEGKVGACEADLQCAATMLLMGYLIDRPGYISDPVIDTAKNQIIYAHCVATNKVYGPKGPANPYHIRSHAEDRKGAAVRSIMPVGVPVTTLKFIPGQKEVVMHMAKAVANVDEEKACRTKLAAEVKDANKMLLDWGYGWHRVTYYGDHRQAVDTVSALLGFKVVLEG
jgi:hypothetical protein